MRGPITLYTFGRPTPMTFGGIPAGKVVEDAMISSFFTIIPEDDGDDDADEHEFDNDVDDGDEPPDDCCCCCCCCPNIADGGRSCAFKLSRFGLFCMTA